MTEYAWHYLEKKKILVVDDEKDITILCKIILEHEGYEVDIHNDPLLALSSFKPNFYNLLILDVTMPNMNGFELYRKMKKIDNKVKVCFLTTSGVYNDILKEFSLTAESFIAEPFEMDEFKDKIKKIIQS